MVVPLVGGFILAARLALAAACPEMGFTADLPSMSRLAPSPAAPTAAIAPPAIAAFFFQLGFGEESTESNLGSVSSFSCSVT